MAIETITASKIVESPKIQPGKPLPLGVTNSGIWKLYYKRGGNPRCELVFKFDGDLQQAIKRAKEYCLRMNFIFIHVEKFLRDLDEDERVASE